WDPRRGRARRDGAPRPRDRSSRGERCRNPRRARGEGLMAAAAPIARELLPRTATVEHGRLVVGGCDVAGLAQTYGTPLYVYYEADLRARCREYRDAFGDGAAYAAKAFLCLAMARLVHDEGLALDVATGGELHVAFAAGFPPERIVLHGNNKTTDE